MPHPVHQLPHLSNTVRLWGPLWTTSAFPFESGNGLLIKLFHGTQRLMLQLMKKSVTFQNLPKLVHQYMNLAILTFKIFLVILSPYTHLSRKLCVLPKLSFCSNKLCIVHELTMEEMCQMAHVRQHYQPQSLLTHELLLMGIFWVSN